MTPVHALFHCGTCGKDMVDVSYLNEARKELSAAEARLVSVERENQELKAKIAQSQNEFRKCEFCGCLTNAKLRACCNQGRTADKDQSVNGALGKE